MSKVDFETEAGLVLRRGIRWNNAK